MKFDELDQKMRVFEELNDQFVLPHNYIVARLDGRSFNRLTKEVHQLEAPYDSKFRDYMIETVKHLMNCGFRISYGYTQSDEISLLFHAEEDAHRNALNLHCYWLLRKKGEKATAASNFLNRKTVAEKNEFLFQQGINFNDLPNWQKRGIGLYWELYEKEGFNPKLDWKVKTERSQIKVDLELPMGG